MLPPPSLPMAIINMDDQMEIKKMVDVIAAASEREAKAHEKAITLSKENDELLMKLKVLIDDNNKLIELYEQATAERSHSYPNGVGDTQEVSEIERAAENLENHLAEMNEENERLMSLYEKAMQERDEFKRMLSCGGQAMDHCPVGVDQGEQFQSQIEEGNRCDCSKASPMVESCYESSNAGDGACDYTEKLVEVDEGKLLVHEAKAASVDEPARLKKVFVFDESVVLKEDFDNFKLNTEAKSSQQSADDHHMDYFPETEVPDSTPVPPMGLVKINLENAQVKLKDSAKNVSAFSSVEKLVSEIDELSRQIEEMERTVKAKQHGVELIKNESLETQERADFIFRKFSALKNSISSFLSSIDYFEQREARARGRVDAASSYLDHKKLELFQLQGRKDELEVVLKSSQQIEEETQKKLSGLRVELEEEKRKQEGEKVVLFSIENVGAENGVDPPKKNWHGKAIDLLRSEEEKTKLQMEIRHCQEGLVVVRKEVDVLKKQQGRIESEIRAVEFDVSKGLKSVDELEIALNVVLEEKKSILEMKEKGMYEIENVFDSYHQHVFEASLKVEEMKILEDELRSDMRRIDELQKARVSASHRKSQVLEASCRSEIIAEDLQMAAIMIEEARSLLN